MSKFFVGQRVRVVNFQMSPRNGCEARIYKASFHNSHKTLGAVFFYFCEVDGWGMIGANGASYAYAEYQLEPIIKLHEPAELSVHELLPFLKEIEKVS